jgi:hypothetical protein
MREQLTFYPSRSRHARPPGSNGARLRVRQGRRRLRVLAAALVRPGPASTPCSPTAAQPATSSRCGRATAAAGLVQHRPQRHRHDIWVRDWPRRARAVLTEGGTWYARTSRPTASAAGAALRLDQRGLPGRGRPGHRQARPFPVDGGKAAFGGFRYAPDGEGIYFISDEPVEQRVPHPALPRPGQPHQVLTAATSPGTWRASTSPRRPPPGLRHQRGRHLPPARAVPARPPPVACRSCRSA